MEKHPSKNIFGKLDIFVQFRLKDFVDRTKS